MICWFVSVVCSCRWLSFSWTVKMSSDSQGSVKGEAPVILSPSSSTSSQGSPLSPSTKPPELPGTTFISLFDLDLDHPPLSLSLSLFPHLTLSLSLASPSFSLSLPLSPPTPLALCHHLTACWEFGVWLCEAHGSGVVWESFAFIHNFYLSSANKYFITLVCIIFQSI